MALDGINIPIRASDEVTPATHAAGDALRKFAVDAEVYVGKVISKESDLTEKLKAQAVEYARVARDGDASATTQALALKKLGDTLDALGRKTGENAQVMKLALDEVRDSAAEASHEMGNVALSDKDAAKTDAVGDLINKKLDSIRDKAVETRLAMRAVRFSGSAGSGAGSFLGTGLSSLAMPALGIGAAGVASALTPGILGAGVGVAGIGSAVAGAGAAGYLALGGSGIMTALGGGSAGAAAMKTMTPEAKQLVEALKPLVTIFHQLQELAQKTLLPQFTKAIKEMFTPQLINAAAVAVQAFSKGFGEFAQVFAKYFGSKEFSNLFISISQQGSKVLPLLAKTLVSLADAFGVLLKAAGPFTIWFTQSMAKGAAWVDRMTKVGAATGGLTKFFDGAKTSLIELGKATEAILKVIVVLGEALAPIGKIILVELAKGLDYVAVEMQKNKPLINDIAKAFGTGLKESIGVVVDALKYLYEGLDKVLGDKGAKWTVAIAAIGVALTLALGPEAAAIVGVITAIGLIKSHWTTISDFLKKSINGWIDLINKLIKTIDKIPFVHIGQLGQLSLGQHLDPQQQKAANMAGYSEGAKIATEGSYYGGLGGGKYVLGGGHHGAVKPGAALDCSGLVYQSMTAAGCKGISDGNAYDQYVQMKNGGAGNWHAEDVGVNGAQPGDIVYWNNGTSATQPDHCGIVASGSGKSATCMQYEDQKQGSGTGPITEYPVMGVFRITLIKSKSSKGNKPPSTPTTPHVPLPPYTPPPTTPTKHAKKAPTAAARASAAIAALGTPGAKFANHATIALAHANAAMSGGHYEKAEKDFASYKKDEEDLLKAQETERKKLQADVKNSTGKAKEEYKKALVQVDKNITSTQAAIIQAGKDMATATADEKKKLIAKETKILQNIEAAVDAAYQAQIDKYQDQLNALNAQATTQNDAQAVADAQQQLNQALLLGGVQAIQSAAATLAQAQLQQQTDILQANIDTLTQNETDFNTAIEGLIAQINGTGPESVSSAMAQLATTVGSGSSIFNALAALLNQYLPGGNPVGSPGSGSGGSGSGAPNTGGASPGTGYGGNPQPPIGPPPKKPIAFAKGGIVSRPTYALIGEAGPEEVIPLSRASGMGMTLNVTVNGVVASDMTKFTHDLRREILKQQNRNGGSLGFR